MFVIVIIIVIYVCTVKYVGRIPTIVSANLVYPSFLPCSFLTIINNYENARVLFLMFRENHIRTREVRDTALLELFRHTNCASSI